MTHRHLFLVLFIMVMFGSAYPVGKLALNESIPPIFYAALRMGIVWVGLLPFWRFEIPPAKYFLPLLGFSLTMGVGVFMFMNFALFLSSLVSPIIIGAQMAVPSGIILSSIFLKEKISLKRWLLVISAFCGIVLVGFDPGIINEIPGLIMAVIMAFLYGLSQVFSRHLKSLNVTLTNAYMSLTGVIFLSIFSIWFEGNPIVFLEEMNLKTWILVLHASVGVSLIAHMSMFYLYKFYPVGTVLPFYTLFPIFGLIQTFIFFREIPSLNSTLGGSLVLLSIFILNRTK